MTVIPSSLRVKHIALAPFDNSMGNQRLSGSKDNLVSAEKHYLAKIWDEWYLGQFSEQWYGWSFNDWGESGCQLDIIQDLYEIDLSPLCMFPEKPDGAEDIIDTSGEVVGWWRYGGD